MEDVVSDAADNDNGRPCAFNGCLSPQFRALVLGADLHGLHAGLCLGTGFEDAIIHDGGRGRRLLVHDGALLRRRVADHVVFGGDRCLRDSRWGRKCNKRAQNKFLHSRSSC